MSKFAQTDNSIPLSIIFALRGTHADINTAQILINSKIVDHPTFIDSIPVLSSVVDLGVIVLDMIANVNNMSYDMDLLENQYDRLCDWDAPGNVVFPLASLLPLHAPESDIANVLGVMCEYVSTLANELEAFTTGECGDNEYNVMSNIVKDLDGYLLSK